MKTGWRVVLIVVTVALLLGALSLGVGFMTGGQLERITPAADRVLESYVGLDAQGFVEMINEGIAYVSAQFGVTP